jgi:hypothetical protein
VLEANGLQPPREGDHIILLAAGICMEEISDHMSAGHACLQWVHLLRQRDTGGRERSSRMKVFRPSDDGPRLTLPKVAGPSGLSMSGIRWSLSLTEMMQRRRTKNIFFGVLRCFDRLLSVVVLSLLAALNGAPLSADDGRVRVQDIFYRTDVETPTPDYAETSAGSISVARR